MSLRRFALYFLGLLLLCLLAAGLYTYRNLPDIVAQQSRAFLRDSGVQDVRLKQLRFSHNRVLASQLRLQGERDGLRFEASVGAVAIGYDWRRILRGQLRSVTLDDVDISIELFAPGESTTASNSISMESLLPRTLLRELPLQSVRVTRWGVVYRSAGKAPVEATGDLLLSDQSRLHLDATHLGSRLTVDARSNEDASTLGAEVSLSDGEILLAQLQAQLERESPDEWHWTLRGALEHAPVLAWLTGLGRDPQLALEMSSLDGVALLGESTFTARIRHPDKLDVSGESLQAVLEQFSGNISMSNNIAGLDYPGIVQGASGNLDVSAQFDGGQVELTLEPTELAGDVMAEQLSLPPDTLRWLKWQRTLPVRWRSREEARVTATPGGAWSWQLSSVDLAAGNNSSEVRAETLNLVGSIEPGSPLRMESNLSASIKARLRSQQLPQLELTFDHRGPLEASQFSLSLDDTAESISLGLQGSSNLATGAGSYKLSARSLDLPYAASTFLPLLRAFGLMTESAALSGGSITLDSELNSGSFDLATLRHKSRLQIQDLSGSYGEYQVEGLALDAGWSGIEQVSTEHPLELSLAKLYVGFDLVDILLRLNLPEAAPIAQPLVQIERFSAGMFGGRVYLPEPRQWDFGGEKNSLTLRAEQWQLADLVALQTGQDIKARGVLEGELPVTLTGGRIIIEKGYLRSLPPGGSIRYAASPASAALANRNPELGLAMDLLSDFRYQLLGSDVELDKEGNLLLALSLAGSNPAQYEGRMINFNINLEQNVDPLLQSLRLSGKLVQKLEDRLQ